MPVPVPPVPTAHNRTSVFHLLKRTLPSSPTAPPPSFATRDQWINSLPSWRRTKTRYVSEYDSHLRLSAGLARAVDAPAMKGPRVIPPLMTPSTPSPPSDTISPILPAAHPQTCPDCPLAPGLYFEDDAGLFAPILEDDSPDVMNADIASSPIEPLTPFGDYVDRAVNATIVHDPLAPSTSHELQLSISASQFGPLPAILKEVPVAALNDRPPSTTSLHKQLVEPMAEWLVSYVWKVCTNLLVLPQSLAPYALPNALQLRQPMPPHLTARVHSLLMSTLLQPSAMFLALWYIVRLPVYLGAPTLGPEYVKERRFRVELLSETRDVLDAESLEGAAAFRLIVLGCMLANKWLDDHTFSNKTWHTLSNVPVHLLNKLEYFALDILSYDLSISSSAWSQWLNHLLSYHHSLTTTTYPQPIARPASNPNGIVRKTIQEIMEAPLGHSASEPVFLGVEQRLKEKFGHEPEAFDIDLDEDGPLREEYLPRRRVNNEGSLGAHAPRHNSQNEPPAHHRLLPLQGSISLPPPAKWSPACDEPICRSSGRTAPMYLPVQPPLAPHYVGTVPMVYHPWPTTGPPYAPLGHHQEGDYPVNTLPVPQYTLWAPMSCPSAAQHPYPVCTSDYYAGPNHVRGYSLGGFDYMRTDAHLSSDGSGCHTRPTPPWTPLHQYGLVTSRRSLAPLPPLNYRSTWIRA